MHSTDTTTSFQLNRRAGPARTCARKTRDDWFSLLMNKDVCIAPVKTLNEVFSDPQVRHRPMVFETDYPGPARIKQLGFPVQYGETVQDMRGPPPNLGEHTEPVLAELGYTQEQIQKLRRGHLTRSLRGPDGAGAYSPRNPNQVLSQDTPPSEEASPDPLFHISHRRNCPS